MNCDLAGIPVSPRPTSSTTGKTPARVIDGLKLPVIPKRKPRFPLTTSQEIGWRSTQVEWHANIFKQRYKNFRHLVFEGRNYKLEQWTIWMCIHVISSESTAMPVNSYSYLMLICFTSYRLQIKIVLYSISDHTAVFSESCSCKRNTHNNSPHNECDYLVH